MHKFHVTKYELNLLRKASFASIAKNMPNSKMNTLYAENIGTFAASRFFVSNGHVALMYIKSYGDDLTLETVDDIVKAELDPAMIKMSGSDMDRVLALAKVKSDIAFDEESISIDGFGMAADAKVEDPEDIFGAYSIFPGRNPGGIFPTPEWEEPEETEETEDPSGRIAKPGKQIDYRATTVALNTRYLAMHSMIANALEIGYLKDRASTVEGTPTHITLPSKHNGPIRFDTIGRKKKTSATLIVMPVVRW